VQNLFGQINREKFGSTHNIIFSKNPKSSGRKKVWSKLISASWQHCPGGGRDHLLEALHDPARLVLLVVGKEPRDDDHQEEGCPDVQVVKRYLDKIAVQIFFFFVVVGSATQIALKKFYH
jgi:hypothetical protein